MVFLWVLWLLGLSAPYCHLRFSSAHAIEQKRIIVLKDWGAKDVKSTGVVQAALPAATSPVPNTELADITYDNFQGIDEPTLPFTATSRGTRNDRAVGCHDQQPSGQSASSEEEGEAEDNSCEMTRKRSWRLADSLMRFSINLLRAVQLESNRTNMVLSPLSIALALAQLALGAANQTEKHLLEVIHLESEPCLHHVLGTLRRRLTASTLSLASRLYLQNGFEVKEKFLKDSEQFYGAKPVTLSGIREDDLVAINEWVKEATNGQIPTFLQQLPANMVMLLLNAIHFHGFWSTQFDARFTRPDVFHLDNEFVVPVEMMIAQKYPLSWFTLESQDVQVAKFPFRSNMSFVVIVPNQYTWNTSHVLENLPYKQLCRLFPKEVPTTVKIPKIRLDYKLELNKVLSQMGLQELFTSPNLHKITDEPLFVSSVQHQSTLELKEDGVEASAATSVAISRSVSAFSLDRPFVFVIFDDETGIPLFLGSIQNPNPNAAPQFKQPQDSSEATDVNEYPMPK